MCVCLSVGKDVGDKSQAVMFSETLEQKHDENVTADQTKIHGQICVFQNSGHRTASPICRHCKLFLYRQLYVACALVSSSRNEMMLSDSLRLVVERANA